jgi:hypothetical protein
MNSASLQALKEQGYKEFFTDEIPATVTPIEDSKENGEGWSYRLTCVGSVANKIYASGRVIPLDQQKRALQDAAGAKRQMTGFLDHPKDYVRGRLEDLASIIPKYHLDENGVTVLDEIRVLPTPKVKLLKTLLDSGVEVRVSQRALGKESVRKWNQQVVMLVEDMKAILGWDFCLLDIANAGRDTQVIAITDAILDDIRRAPLIEDEETTEAKEMGKKNEETEFTLTDEKKTPVNTGFPATPNAKQRWCGATANTEAFGAALNFRISNTQFEYRLDKKGAVPIFGRGEKKGW